MTDMDKVHKYMTLTKAMRHYSYPDKEKFQCSYPDFQEQRPETTFFADFSVADVYGVDAIKDTYKRAFCGWKHDVKMFTELVAALNHKIWEWYDAGVDEYSKLYDGLWRKADDYLQNNFTKKSDVAYWFAVLD